jgi:hypothetical protein
MARNGETFLGRISWDPLEVVKILGSQEERRRYDVGKQCLARQGRIGGHCV